ncbi:MULTISPECIES: hypothetical protein [Pseudomonas]|uniref:hypothetical protein n=1 Tax=Pseudomonas TaxID=286 RepID=UPI00053DB94A|nr:MULTISPECIES: hypothetical protein [Pseudomonas]KQJ51492.1 hypothetical protein AN399_31960 [Pseudomonas aeruginosa]KRU69621.1 hypothetical protein AN449_02475 [Pseudomonas aeruginosa]KRV12016.1 hypothetical protein AN458_29860 [Pseudomonas aeruginosa]KSQ90266.1 hypothetical protein APB42_21070 [Pseudomonas aeruginosa]KXE60406.1 hypothetical protein AW928_13525 [Pseudomonas aeruginosa]
MHDKYKLAIIRHEKAKQVVQGLSRDIGAAINSCPISIRAQSWDTPNSERDELWDEASGKHKTHLWHAFKHREPSDCGYGTVGLGDDGIDDALAPGGEFECEHCRRAYQLIRDRRCAKQELGRARLSIRALGRAALEESTHD